MIAALLLACGGDPPPVVRPPGVPEAAAFLRYSGNDLKLDDVVIAPWQELTHEGDQPFEPLLDALDDRLVKEAGTWVALPSNASWGEARRSIHTVYQAGAGPVWLGAMGAGEAFGPLDNRPPGRPILSCPEGPLEVVGVAGRLALELHADDAQTWTLAHVRFKPKIKGEGDEVKVAELLPLACWKPASCDVLVRPELVDACRQGAAASTSVPDRVEVGGSVGCALTLGKGSGGHAGWRQEVPKLLGGLGLDAATGVMLLADENVALDPILSVLAGLSTHGITNPQLGMLRMGSADGAPTCTADVKDAAALELAGARWLGQQLGTLGSP